MKNKITLIGIIALVIIIIGIVMTAVLGLNVDLMFEAHKQIDIQIGQEFNNDDIIGLVKEVVGDNKQVVIQKVEVYEDMVSISLKDVTDDELKAIVTKINEKYGLEKTVDMAQVTDIPNIELVDIVKPYIMPVVVSFIIILIYVISYVLIKNKMGANINLIKAILIMIVVNIIVQGLYLAIFAITRLPINNLTMPIAIIIYAYTTIKVLAYFEDKSKIIEKNK